MTFGYPMDFDTIATAANEAAKLNAMLKTLQKQNDFSVHVDGHHNLRFNCSSPYGYQTALRNTIEEWLKHRIADRLVVIERELAKR